jgi:hypothetical protein
MLGELHSRLGSNGEDRSFLPQLRIEPQLSEAYPVTCTRDLSPGSQTPGLLLQRTTYISLLSCGNKAPILRVTRFICSVHYVHLKLKKVWKLCVGNKSWCFECQTFKLYSYSLLRLRACISQPPCNRLTSLACRFKSTSQNRVPVVSTLPLQFRLSVSVIVSVLL